MKSSRQGILLAALLAAGVSSMLLPGWYARRAADRAVLASGNGGAFKMPGPADEHSSAAMARGQTTIISKATGPIALGAGPVRISLAGAGTTERKSLASSLDKLEPGRRIYLVLRNLSTTEQPGVLYHVYFDLPDGAKPGKNDPRYAGSLNFFDVANPGVPRSDGASFRSYDITDIARSLKARHLLSEQPTVTISPAGTPAVEAKPMIGEVELVEQ